MKINENQKEELLEFIKKNYNENLGLSNLRDLIYKKFSVLYHTSSVKYWVKIATNDQWLKELREKQEQMLKWKKEAEKVDVSEKEEIYLYTQLQYFMFIHEIR